MTKETLEARVNDSRAYLLECARRVDETRELLRSYEAAMRRADVVYQEAQCELEKFSEEETRQAFTKVLTP